MTKKVFDRIAECLREALSMARREPLTADMLIAYEIKYGRVPLGETVTLQNGQTIKRVAFKS